MTEAAPDVEEAWLAAQVRLQLDFGRRFPHPDGGAAWLASDGRPDLERPVFTWVTARMAHVYALGSLLGVPGAGELADAALSGLTGRLHDDVHGGWFASAGTGSVLEDSKQAYSHAFVLLAASTASVAGRPAAEDLLEEAVEVLDRHFLDPASGLFVDRWDRTWSRLDGYRGVNANMHTVEACLAAADATRESRFLDRALHISDQVVRRWADDHDWRVPEHFDSRWRPLLEHHRHDPAHPFQPYGATVGHALEWSRLVLQLRAALGEDAPGWMLGAAESLFERAVLDGWGSDGAEGFVYTTDWEGRPVVRERFHWVLAEAICAAAALFRVTGAEQYDEKYRAWWAHARRHWVDPVNGSWQHQLAPDLAPTDTVWSGRPDLYHSVHAALLPRLPLWPGAARQLRGRTKA